MVLDHSVLDLAPAETAAAVADQYPALPIVITGDGFTSQITAGILVAAGKALKNLVRI